MSSCDVEEPLTWLVVPFSNVAAAQASSAAFAVELCQKRETLRRVRDLLFPAKFEFHAAEIMFPEKEINSRAKFKGHHYDPSVYIERYHHLGQIDFAPYDK